MNIYIYIYDINISRFFGIISSVLYFLYYFLLYISINIKLTISYEIQHFTEIVSHQCCMQMKAQEVTLNILSLLKISILFQMDPHLSL